MGSSTVGRTALPVYLRIKNGARVDIDGRNNIFILPPAVFWDEELCVPSVDELRSQGLAK